MISGSPISSTSLSARPIGTALLPSDAIITAVTRPIAAQGNQSITITGTDFPTPPSVTITGPNAQSISLSVISASATQITVTGIFALAGTYQVVVSGSAPFAVDSAPPVIASVLPPLVSGWAASQTITIIGSGFHANPTVMVLNPDGTPRSIGVISSGPNAILATIPFDAPWAPGTYTLTVDDSPPFAVSSVPRPVITAIDPIYHGITETQDITIHGTGFAPGQLVQIYDPVNQLINVRILSVTPTEITVRGSFFAPGNYTFHVWVADPVTVTSVAKPPTITYTGPIYDNRSEGGGGGVFTIGGYGFTASPQGQPPIPIITITDPNGQPVAFDFNNSEDTWVGVNLHPPLPPGEYTITVDGSPPWHQQSIPYIGYAGVTAVDPAPQAGTYADQDLTLTGENFPTEASPSVIVSDPNGQSVTVTVIPPWTSTSVTIRGVFFANGLWGFRIGQSAIFYINSIPPVGPVATIQAVTRPTTGSDAEQFLTIQGTLFQTPPTIHITNPSGQAVPFTLLYGSTTAAVISGVFNQPGIWTVQIDNSAPFQVEALPELATITAIERPQAGLDTAQTIRIDGTDFTAAPVVTVTGPSGQPIAVSVVSSTATAITIALPPDLPEGVYYVSADYSPPFAVLALPIPAPTITAVTPPQSGLTESQTITLTGTWFRDPVSVTVIGPGGFVATTVIASSRTSIDLSGVFLRPGTYSVTVMADGRTSLPFLVQALPPAPPVITDVTRPQAGQTSPQTLTLTTTGYLTGPAVTVLGPDGVSIPVTLVSAPSAPLGGLVTVSGVFVLDGIYTVSVDGSAPFQVTSLPPIPVITAVTPRPFHGVEDQQTVVIEGLHFSPSPTVRVTDPQGRDVPVTILSRSTSRTTLILTVSGVFLPEGTYWFYVDNSAGFPVHTVAPPAVITSVTPPQAGETDPQLLTITGTNFSDNPIVTVRDPYGVPIPVNVISVTSSTSIVIRGVFLHPGRYLVTVDDSEPFAVDAIPAPLPPQFITHPIRRMRQFVLPTSPDHRWMFISRLELLMRTGIGLTRGKGSDPKVMLQLSRDGGKTWSSEEWRSAGETGAYLRRVRWLRQGRYRDGVIRLTVSDPVDWQLLSLSGDLTEGSH